MTHTLDPHYRIVDCLCGYRLRRISWERNRGTCVQCLHGMYATQDDAAQAAREDYNASRTEECEPRIIYAE